MGKHFKKITVYNTMGGLINQELLITRELFEECFVQPFVSFLSTKLHKRNWPKFMFCAKSECCRLNSVYISDSCSRKCKYAGLMDPVHLVFKETAVREDGAHITP